MCKDQQKQRGYQTPSTYFEVLQEDQFFGKKYKSEILDGRKDNPCCMWLEKFTE